MECLYHYGGSRKHTYEPYKTLFFRRQMYRCIKCHNKITSWEYENWKQAHIKWDLMIKNYMNNRFGGYND